MYKHKTTLEQYNEMKSQSKNDGELLHKVYMNETNNGMHYMKFIDHLRLWLITQGEQDMRRGVEKINKYLYSKLV